MLSSRVYNGYSIGRCRVCHWRCIGASRWPCVPISSLPWRTGWLTLRCSPLENTYMFKVLWEMNKCSGMSWFLYFFIFWKSTINMWKIKCISILRNLRVERTLREANMMAERRKTLWAHLGLVGTPEWTPVYAEQHMTKIGDMKIYN